MKKTLIALSLLLIASVAFYSFMPAKKSVSIAAIEPVSDMKTLVALGFINSVNADATKDAGVIGNEYYNSIGVKFFSDRQVVNMAKGDFELRLTVDYKGVIPNPNLSEIKSKYDLLSGSGYAQTLIFATTMKSYQIPISSVELTKKGKKAANGFSFTPLEAVELFEPSLMQRADLSGGAYIIENNPVRPLFILAHSDYFTKDKTELITIVKDPKVFCKVPGGYVLLSEWE